MCHWFDADGKRRRVGHQVTNDARAASSTTIRRMSVSTSRSVRFADAAWMHLLFARHACVSRSFARLDLKEAVRENRWRNRARRACQATLSIFADRTRHQHRRLPADRTNTGSPAAFLKCLPRQNIRSAVQKAHWSNATSICSHRWRETDNHGVFSITTLDSHLPRRWNRAHPRASQARRCARCAMRACRSGDGRTGDSVVAIPNSKPSSK